MGYSIMVEFPDIELRDKVLDFLINNAKSFNQLIPTDIEIVRGPVVDPAYPRDEARDRLIGYDFSGSSQIHARLAYLFCYWIMKRLPQCKLWYDGDEEWEVPEECDDHGFHSIARIERLQKNSLPEITRKLIFEKLIKDLENFNEPVHEELKRLTELWEQTT